MWKKYLWNSGYDNRSKASNNDTVVYLHFSTNQLRSSQTFNDILRSFDETIKVTSITNKKNSLVNWSNRLRNWVTNQMSTYINLLLKSSSVNITYWFLFVGKLTNQKSVCKHPKMLLQNFKLWPWNFHW